MTPRPRRVKFSAGQAVWAAIWPRQNLNRLALLPGTIVRAGDMFFTVQLADGPRRVQPINLIHRGFCVDCDVEAYEQDGRLFCPYCETEPLAFVPAERRPRWRSELDQHYAENLYEMATTGCSYPEARHRSNQRHLAAWRVTGASVAA